MCLELLEAGWGGLEWLDFSGVIQLLTSRVQNGSAWICFIEVGVQVRDGVAGNDLWKPLLIDVAWPRRAFPVSQPFDR